MSMSGANRRGAASMSCVHRPTPPGPASPAPIRTGSSRSKICYATARRARLAEKVEAALDPADEGFGRMLLKAERSERLVDHLHRTAQLPAGARKNENVVHEADDA